MRRIILAALGVVLLLGAPAVYLSMRPATAVGDVAALVDPTSSNPSQLSRPSAPPVAPEQGQARQGNPVIPVDAVRPGRLVPQDPAQRPDPARLAIPALGIDAPVVAVGIEDDGEMEIPADVDQAGWYRFGASPGAEGSAVIAGHVDSRTQGLGIFARLRELEVGARVDVAFADGTSEVFVVTARQEIDKPTVPLDAVFSRSGSPRLTLITCGGEFDATERSYRSNVIVTAVPAG